MPKKGKVIMADKKLLDQVVDLLRIKHYSYRTEQTYVDWIRRYILFHNKCHPRDIRTVQELLGHKDVKTTMKLPNNDHFPHPRKTGMFQTSVNLF
jgi:integrase